MASDGKVVGGGNQEVEKRRDLKINCENVEIDIHSFEVYKISHKNSWNFSPKKKKEIVGILKSFCIRIQTKDFRPTQLKLS